MNPTTKMIDPENAPLPLSFPRFQSNKSYFLLIAIHFAGKEYEKLREAADTSPLHYFSTSKCRFGIPSLFLIHSLTSGHKYPNHLHCEIQQSELAACRTASGFHRVLRGCLRIGLPLIHKSFTSSSQST